MAKHPLERRHIGIELGADDDLVDEELLAHPVTRTIKPLGVDAGRSGKAEIIGDVGLVDHHIAAILRRRHACVELREPLERVDLNGPADRTVVRGKALQEDAKIIVAGDVDIGICEDDDIAAIGLRGDIGRTRAR